MRKFFIYIISVIIIGNIISMIINNEYIKEVNKEVNKEDKSYKLSFLSKYKKVISVAPVKDKIIKQDNTVFDKKAINNKIKDKYKINILAIYFSDNPVVFLKSNNKKYILNEQEKINKYITVQKINRKFIELKSNNQLWKVYINKKYLEKELFEKQKELNVVFNESGNNIIDKKTFNYYIKNQDKIQKEINFSFRRNILRVNRIKHNSIFYNLGIRKNDIIKEINYEVVDKKMLLKLYSKINELEDFIITIKRNEEMIELNYSVR